MGGFQEEMFFLKLSEGKFNSVWRDYVLEANDKGHLKEQVE